MNKKGEFHMKIGAITIGQAPRTDVTADILHIFDDSLELVQAGGWTRRRGRRDRRPWTRRNKDRNRSAPHPHPDLGVAKAAARDGRGALHQAPAAPTQRGALGGHRRVPERGKVELAEPADGR